MYSDIVYHICKCKYWFLLFYLCVYVVNIGELVGVVVIEWVLAAGNGGQVPLTVGGGVAKWWPQWPWGLVVAVGHFGVRAHPTHDTLNPNKIDEFG